MEIELTRCAVQIDVMTLTNGDAETLSCSAVPGERAEPVTR
jgi:hypothetical protein